MELKGRVAVGLVIAGAVLALWMCRYDIKTEAGGGPPVAYVLDRWTGAVVVHFPNGTARRTVEEQPARVGKSQLLTDEEVVGRR